jgi:hypothetical protein|tara:strand:+ start:183 stop:395 length:213 start_codon:yes stop_codon:yes gene_type:complete
MSSTKKYLDLLDEEEELNRKLFGLKIRKVELSKKVWKECNHEWERCSDYDDLCKKICKKCTLYYNHYLYE